MRNRLMIFWAVILTAMLAEPLSGQDKKGNIMTDAADVAKMALAKQKLYGGNFISALSTFRDVETRNPNDPDVKYYVALCQFYLGQYDQSRATLEKVTEGGKPMRADSKLLLAKLYQKEGACEKSLEQLRDFVSGDEVAVREASLITAQCGNALKYTAAPLDVKVENLGNELNSRFDDKNPSVTADGRHLYFTTRRPESSNSPVDVEGDGKYFESIFVSQFDSASGRFATAAPLAGPVNTEAHDACTGISHDGRTMFLYKNDADKKESRGGNVFISKNTTGKWRTPQTLGKPVNSTYWEGGACMSPDGKMYLFSSERPGGYGQSDIWMVERKKKKEWGTPVNLGPEINSEYDEAGMFLAPDGKTLFFCSNGPRSMGGYDVFRTVYENGKWSTPENLGYPINTPAKEGQLSVSADARYAYLSSDRPGGHGESDIYRVDLKDYAILEKGGKRQRGNELAILRGVIRDGFEGYGLEDVAVVLADEGGKEISTITTNENGEYFFMVKEGRYKLNVKAKGFEPVSDEVQVGSSEKETVVVEKGYLMKKQ